MRGESNSGGKGGSDISLTTTPKVVRARCRSYLALATAAAAIPLLASQHSARAADLYWDINGATANSGTTAAGTWSNTVSNWNSDPAGAGAGTVSAWIDGSIAH